MVPASDGVEADEEAGWDWQDDAGAEALHEPHVAVTAEGPVPVPGESAVQHEAERPVLEGGEVDASLLAADESAPEPVTEPPSAVPHDDEQGWSFDQGDDNAGAELLQNERALDVEQGAETFADESAVQHIEARPVPPRHSPRGDVLPAEMGQPEEHTFSPPRSALPSGDADAARLPVDDAVDDPWDLEPVEPETPPQPSPPAQTEGLAPAAEVLDASAEDSTPAATADAYTPARDGIAEPVRDEPPADPLDFEFSDAPVDAPASTADGEALALQTDADVEAESAVQHVQNRPVVNVNADDNDEHLAASQKQPQQHTLSLPASSLPAETGPVAAPADPVEVVAASPGSSDKADEDWGWNAAGDEDREQRRRRRQRVGNATGTHSGARPDPGRPGHRLSSTCRGSFFLD